MLHVKIGRHQMQRSWILKFWKFPAAAGLVVALFFFLIQSYGDIFSVMTEKRAVPETSQQKKKSENPCPTMICAEDHFSFFIQSGAANLVPPTICFRNQLVLGKAKENSGVGINAAIFNGKTGELIMTGNYDMYAGEVGPLIETLKKTETGSLVLIASFDEPASKLNGEARTLLLDLGSSSAQSLAFRDNWVFVGGKGAAVKSPFEKHIKNDQEKNKYDGWPEVLDLSGCIPQYLG